MRGVDPQALLVANLPLVERLCRFFCRGSRMTAEDVEDFIGHVRVHLLDDDCAVLRSFEGRCSLETFLALTIQRQLFDYRAKIWGRFRNSAAATRSGPAAMRLETLIVRDRQPLDDVLATLAQEGHAMTRAEAERIIAAFPERKTRATEVGVDDVAQHLAANGNDIEEDAALGERRIASKQVTDAMRHAIADMSVQDRTILRLHFDAGLSIADIARTMSLEQRPLYRRIGRMLATLRERLLASGVDAQSIHDLLGRSDTDLDFGLRDVAKPAAVSSTTVEELDR